MKRKFLSFVLAVCLIVPCCLALAGCGNAELKYAFVTYADTSGVNGNIITLNRYAKDGATPEEYGYSASTYFNQEDKNLDWDGSRKEISFDLDLSAMEDGDLTMFVLAFNEKVNVGAENEAYDHVDEIRFSIAKSNDKYLVKESMGASSSLETDRAPVLESDFEFTNNNVKAAFVVEYDEETKELSYKITVAGLDVVETTRNVEGNFETARNSSEKIEGFRYLWNARTSVDGIKLSNIDIKNA